MSFCEFLDALVRISHQALVAVDIVDSDGLRDNVSITVDAVAEMLPNIIQTLKHALGLKSSGQATTAGKNSKKGAKDKSQNRRETSVISPRAKQNERRATTSSKKY